MMKKISLEDRQVLERLVNEYGADRLLVEFNFKQDIKPAIVAAGIATAGLLGAKAAASYSDTRDFNKDKSEIHSDIDSSPKNPYDMSDEDYQIFMDKVDAVNSEIERVFNLRGISMDELGFNPEDLVYYCYLHNFDLPLAMAQLHVESHYGTTPRAKKTNSMFSIGAYDNGKNSSVYNSQTDSIEPYIIIMKRDYLDGGNRSISSLLSDGGFVNSLGQRYASSKSYERDVRVTRNGIIKRHPILETPFHTFNLHEGFFYDRNTGKMVKRILS